MKINRESRSIAKKLFSLCRKDGRMDGDRIRGVVKKVAEARPRNHLAILTCLAKLVELEEKRRSAVVETSVSLGAMEAHLSGRLRASFGEDLSIRTVTNPALLGGMRIQVGSDLWDGSIRGRLEALRRSF